MDFFGLAKLFRYKSQAEPAVHFVVDGAVRGRCKRCGSQSIFHVRAVLDRVKSPLVERLREQQEKKRKEGDDPKDAA